MPRRNRVDPWGDPHAVAARGLLTGNRGCLVDDAGQVVRHHVNRAWITCRLEFRGWRHPLDAPRRWTPLFFLDDAVALAAGHRPCATCRREDYLAYRDAVGRALGASRPLRAAELDARLAAERMTGTRPTAVATTGVRMTVQPRRGRGLEWAGRRLLTDAAWSSLPGGTVVVVGGRAALVRGAEVRTFGFDGWAEPSAPSRRDGDPAERPRAGVTLRPSSGDVQVLTPPTSVLALGHGFRPVLHPSATR